jgi:hypothetical protein
MTARGAFVAATVAGLLQAGAPLVAHAKGGKVTCKQSNSCSGKGGCKSAQNECKGKNSCEGHEFQTTEDDCKKAGGSVVASGEKKK